MPWWQQRSYIESMQIDVEERAYEQWKQNGRKGPQPRMSAELHGPAEDIADIESHPGANVQRGRFGG